jgi:hypothetical protein
MTDKESKTSLLLDSDKNLLRLAAKAAGYPISEGYLEETTSCIYWVYIDSDEETHPPPTDSVWTELWNPLIDDGDALRLVVNLNLDISVCVEGHVSVDEYNDDPYAATRRAIVRAAAEIGKQKE